MWSRRCLSRSRSFFLRRRSTVLNGAIAPAGSPPPDRHDRRAGRGVGLLARLGGQPLARLSLPRRRGHRPDRRDRGRRDRRLHRPLPHSGGASAASEFRGPRLRLRAVAVVGAIAFLIPVNTGPSVRATFDLNVRNSSDGRVATGTFRLDPPDAAKDAYWFNVTSWQGKDGPAHIDKPEQIGPGLYRITQPIHVDGTWKTTLRLHKGRHARRPADLHARRSRHPGAPGAGRGSHDPLVRARPSPAAARAEEGRPRLAHSRGLPGRRRHLLRAGLRGRIRPGAARAPRRRARRAGHPSAPAQARRGRARNGSRRPAPATA